MLRYNRCVFSALERGLEVPVDECTTLFPWRMPLLRPVSHLIPVVHFFFTSVLHMYDRFVRTVVHSIYRIALDMIDSTVATVLVEGLQ